MCKGPAACCLKKLNIERQVGREKSRFIQNAGILGGWRTRPKAISPLLEQAEGFIGTQEEQRKGGIS